MVERKSASAANRILRWHSYQPRHDDASARGPAFAFGRTLDTVYHLERARTIVSLDGTPLRLYAAEALRVFLRYASCMPSQHAAAPANRPVHSY